MNRVPVDLTGPPQTMLATLYAKALDADAPDSILRDQHAKAAVASIDYDWEATGIKARQAPSNLLSAANRRLGRAMAAVAPLRKVGQYHRYAFGKP